MKLQLGENECFECESVEIEFIDQTSITKNEDALYVNPSTIKYMSVKGLNK